MQKNPDGSFTILGDDLPSKAVVEMFNIEAQKDRLITAAGDDYVSTTRNILEETKGVLPFFAERYNISADINDYVLAPVSVFLSGIPNKKGHAFTMEELTTADPNRGQLKYETFNRQPLHEDHVNGDFTKARGLVLASSLQHAPEFEGDVYRCICLQAYDRKTHPGLVGKILSGAINSYSMGARAQAFECSICKQPVPGKCNHIPKGMLLGTGFDKFPIVDGRAAYLEARGTQFFEISALNKNNPAWAGATNRPHELMRFT